MKRMLYAAALGLLLPLASLGAVRTLAAETVQPAKPTVIRPAIATRESSATTSVQPVQWRRYGGSYGPYNVYRPNYYRPNYYRPSYYRPNYYSSYYRPYYYGYSGASYPRYYGYYGAYYPRHYGYYGGNYPPYYGGYGAGLWYW